MGPFFSGGVGVCMYFHTFSCLIWGNGLRVFGKENFVGRDFRLRAWRDMQLFFACIFCHFSFG